jgi:hypothetical protein
MDSISSWPESDAAELLKAWCADIELCGVAEDGCEKMSDMLPAEHMRQEIHTKTM